MNSAWNGKSDLERVQCRLKLIMILAADPVTTQTRQTWGDKHYNNYNHYLRKRYGERVYKVSLQGGFTCPNRDGSIGRGGCNYCNNDSFVPPFLNPEMPIQRQLMTSIPFLQQRYGADKYIAYFQAYSNTYAELDELKTLYAAAVEHPDVVGLDIGTRSDCVDEELLVYLARLNERVPVTLEYGIESIHAATLAWMNRGHDFQSVVDAVALTKRFGLSVGGHIILGFPVETVDMMRETGLAANQLGLDFLKIHQLQVVKKTVLAKQFQADPFKMFSPAEYVALVCDILEQLNPGIVIQRLFGAAPLDLLIAPHWGNTIPELLYWLESELTRRGSWQGSAYDSGRWVVKN